MKIKPFRYIVELDCFFVTKEFNSLSCRLGIAEWHAVVDICRLLGRDNDFAEHMFDNWDERYELEQKAASLGFELKEEDGKLMIIVPQRFSDGKDGLSRQENYEQHNADGPCHSPEIRKRFWTDVLKSLELSYDFLFDLAMENAQDDYEFASQHPDFKSDFRTPEQIRLEIEKIKNEIGYV